MIKWIKKFFEAPLIEWLDGESKYIKTYQCRECKHLYAELTNVNGKLEAKTHGTHDVCPSCGYDFMPMPIIGRFKYKYANRGWCFLVDELKFVERGKE